MLAYACEKLLQLQPPFWRQTGDTEQTATWGVSCLEIKLHVEVSGTVNGMASKYLVKLCCHAYTEQHPTTSAIALMQSKQGALHAPSQRNCLSKVAHRLHEPQRTFSCFSSACQTDS